MKHYPRISPTPPLEIQVTEEVRVAYALFYAAVKHGEVIGASPMHMVGAGLMLLALAGQGAEKCLDAVKQAMLSGLPLAWETVELILEEQAKKGMH